MKRGLAVLDLAEVPEHEWRNRMRILRNRLAGERVDVALIYGDVSRSDDIGYLTNLCIYWNEGVLAVPVIGDPVFLTKLSPRVHPWMRRISTIETIHSGRRFGDLAARLAESRMPGTLGFVDAALWPAAVIQEITAVLPGWRVRRLGGLVREQRAVPSEHELALLRRGAVAVAMAADESAAEGLRVSDRVATVERTVRGAGFLDVQVHTSTTSDGVVGVRIAGQYRTGWLYAARLAETAGQWPSALRAALAQAIGAARAGGFTATLAVAAQSALAGLPAGSSAQVRWVNQTDLATHGEYHRPDLALPAGAVVAIAIDVLFADGGYAEVADTVLIGVDGAENLTAGRSAG